MPPWCERQHTPFVRPRCGFDSCRRLSSRAGAGRFSGMKRFDSASGLQRHDRDEERLLRAEAAPVIAMSATGRGFESRPERTRSGSSVGRAVPGLHAHDRSSPLTSAPRAGEDRLSLAPGAREAENLRPATAGSPTRRSSRHDRGSHRSGCGPEEGGYPGERPTARRLGRSRVRRPPATATATAAP